MSNNNPSIDPANNDSLAGSIRFAFNKVLQQTDGMLPAQVIAYDRTTNRVQVQLMISLITTDGSIVPRPQIASLPVLVLGGGGFMINFPLNEGDLGWILANDRDISLFLQSYTQTAPNTYRVKNFSDGLFIPDIMRGYSINPADVNSMVISNTSGTTRISISATSIDITAPVGVNITTPLVTINGNLLVNGNIGATGTITPGV